MLMNVKDKEMETYVIQMQCVITQLEVTLVLVYLVIMEMDLIV